MVACSQFGDKITENPDYVMIENDPVITATPFQPEEFGEVKSTQAAGDSQTSSTPSVQRRLYFNIDNSVPDFLIGELSTGKLVELTEDGDIADITLAFSEDCEEPFYAVYVLVAPFPTVRDSVSGNQLQSAWAKPQEVFNNQPLLMSIETHQMLSQQWGGAEEGAITILPPDQLLEFSWANNQYAIIPFHTLNARWKVIKIDGLSTLDQETRNDNLPLSFGYCLTGTEGQMEKLEDEDFTIHGISTNRELEKMTSLTMTGVTALVRATAHRMEVKGVTYPGEIVKDLLLNSDFTHISNEVAFAESCPYPDPYQTDLRFCSSPEYIELFSYLDIDIIELTGNHIQDWSREDFVSTLDMYETGGFAYFGGGRTLGEAKEALIIEHNGNKLAFIGCNAVGPYGAWATDTTSGNVPCGDYSWITEEVEKLSAKGYLVIVTLQHNEFYGMMKTGPQILDFNPLAQAGAVIVSGSQAHYPNPFGFEGQNFIHYGLGNLFFDQMDAYTADGIQREFVDTHYFYGGRYISTEIHTLYLEDFAQPRYMTAEERKLFLENAFEASGW